MKTRFLATAAAAVLLAQGAQASDGTITFSGQLNNPTCNIATSSFTVALPVLSVASLKATAGTTAGDTSFKLDLSGCTAGLTNATAYFEAGATIDTTTKNLKNATGTAANVQIQLLNSDGTPIDLSGASGAQGVAAAPIVANAATAKFIARYYATSNTPGAGTVGSSVTYSMVYN